MKTISNKLTLFAKIILLAKAFVIIAIGLLVLIYFKEFIISSSFLLLGFFFLFFGIKLNEIGIDESGEIIVKNFTHKKSILRKNIQKVSVNFLFATLHTKEKNGASQKHYFLLSFKQSLELNFAKSEQMIEKELLKLFA